MTVDDVLLAARSCLETPFRHQGRIPGEALDCAGLIVVIAQSLGVEYFDPQGYGRHPANGMLERALDLQPCLERVSVKQTGDVLLLRIGREPMHLAILANDTLIHAYSDTGKVCEHDLTEQWARRIVRVYRFKGLA